MAAVFPVPPIPQNATAYLAGVAEPFMIDADQGLRVEHALSASEPLVTFETTHGRRVTVRVAAIVAVQR